MGQTDRDGGTAMRMLASFVLGLSWSCTCIAQFAFAEQDGSPRLKVATCQFPVSGDIDEKFAYRPEQRGTRV